MTELLISLAFPALVGLFFTAAALTLMTQWRLRFAILGVQYVLAAVLISQAVIWQVAAVKAIVGLLVVVILGLTGQGVATSRRVARQAAEAPARGRPFAVLRRIEFQTNLPFRVVAVLLAAVATWYLVAESGYAFETLPLSLNLAGFLLIILGLLGLGLSEEAMNVGIGLLMVLNGFELLYASVERSLTVVALLAAVNFGVALAVSYVALVPYGAKGGTE